MSFEDDMQRDLESVFFVEDADVAIINGAEIVGKFDRTAYRWSDISGSHSVFTAPAKLFPANLDRELTVVIDDTNYKIVRPIHDNDLLRLVLD